LLAGAAADASEAEACFNRALVIARSQNAKSWELRAAVSLGRTWQRQGKREEAAQLLKGIHEWFTEGFETADLRAATILLDS
jgi:predicted ATPase